MRLKSRAIILLLFIFESFTASSAFAECLKTAAHACPVQNKESKVESRSCLHIVINRVDLQKKLASPDSARSLPAIARATMSRYFSRSHFKNDSVSSKQSEILKGWIDTIKVAPELASPAGVFVTLSKDGKTRACWGSVYPRESNLVRETVLATLGALSKDYRFKPVSASEISELKVQVTVIRGLQAVNDIKTVNPLKDGIMVRSGGKGGVILPGEARDAYYEFVLARLKAGIQPKEACQVYKLKAEIYD